MGSFCVGAALERRERERKRSGGEGGGSADILARGGATGSQRSRRTHMALSQRQPYANPRIHARAALPVWPNLVLVSVAPEPAHCRLAPIFGSAVASCYCPTAGFAH